LNRAARADLAVDLAGVKLPNPFVLASGILGTHASLMHRAALAGAGAITAKSAGPEPRRGHPNPSCVDWGEGLLNAIGLANPGVESEVALLAETRARLAELGVPLIASVFGGTADDFGRAAAAVARAEPDMIELNISCPNVGSEFGEPFAASCDSAAAATASARREVGVPLIVKLAPNVPDIALIAEAVVDAGADALCAINTMPGMLIDPESGRPILSNRVGGVSGAALRPIAVHAVYHIAARVPVPIIGTGGVASIEDAVEMLSAGAAAVGVGSVVAREGPAAFTRLVTELEEWLASRDMTLDAVRGRAQGPGRAWPEPASQPPVPHVPDVPDVPDVPPPPAASTALSSRAAGASKGGVPSGHD
jgi:dihydroorotate dehydrogenase (NAD+) catalytic subunit